MSLVELRLSPRPWHVRTARLVTVAAARRAGLDPELVDDLRLAIGEACSRAVALHAEHAPADDVVVTVSDGPTGLTVTVSDRGPAAPEQDPGSADVLAGLAEGEGAEGVAGVSLTVLAGLVDDLDVAAAGEAGTTVTMRWPLPVRPAGGPSSQN